MLAGQVRHTRSDVAPEQPLDLRGPAVQQPDDGQRGTRCALVVVVAVDDAFDLHRRDMGGEVENNVLPPADVVAPSAQHGLAADLWAGGRQAAQAVLPMTIGAGHAVEVVTGEGFVPHGHFSFPFLW